MAMQPEDHRRAIAAMDRALGPSMLAAVHDLFRSQQDRFLAAQPATAVDQSYGTHVRQILDLYAPTAPAPTGAGVPVLLWVHGGGFVRGEKASAHHPFNAHAGRWAARMGMLGAVMNYRLAPEYGWPAGGEDVGAAIDWLHDHAADHGGDPNRIVVVGTSAGAVHAATHLQLRPDDPGVRGIVLLSGLYGFTPLDDRDTAYYVDAEGYADRAPRDAIVATTMPLLIVCAEFDPPRFQAEAIGLLAARLDRHGSLPRSHIASGHNHFSLAYHIGSADTRLADEVRNFVIDVTQKAPDHQ